MKEYSSNHVPRQTRASSNKVPRNASYCWEYAKTGLNSGFGTVVICPAVEDFTVDSNTLEHGCRMILAGFPSFTGLGLEGGHIPTFWLLLFS